MARQQGKCGSLWLLRRGREAARNSESLSTHTSGTQWMFAGCNPGKSADSDTGRLTEGGGGDLRRVKRQGELFRCHQGGKVPRQRGADSSVHAVPAPRAQSQHGRRGRGRGSSESGQEGGGAASAEPVRKRGTLGAPDGGAEVRAPPRRSRRAGVVDQAPARELWSSRGREVVKQRPREMRRRPPRSEEPRPSAIAASRCRLFLYSLPPCPAFRPDAWAPPAPLGVALEPWPPLGEEVPTVRLGLWPKGKG